MAQVNAKTPEAVDQEIEEELKVQPDESQEKPETTDTAPPTEDNPPEDSALESQVSDDGGTADREAKVGDGEVDNDTPPDFEALFEAEYNARVKAENRIKSAQGEMTRATQERATAGKRLGELEGMLPEFQRLKMEEEERKLNKSRKPLPIDDIREMHGDELADGMKQLQDRSDALEVRNQELMDTVGNFENKSDQSTANAIIKTSHEDAFDIVFGGGRENLDNWFATLPSLQRRAAELSLTEGTPQEVIETISAYKDSKKTTSNTQGSDAEHQRRLELARKVSTPNAQGARVPTRPKARVGGIEAERRQYKEWQRTGYRPSDKEISDLEAWREAA